MFRKILLSYFPDNDEYGELSPIRFHLKLLSAKLFYWINLKYWLENRRIVETDSRFSYFDMYNFAFDDINEENFYYSYKNFSLLNGFDNINIYCILPAISLLILVLYKDEKNIQTNLKIVLYWKFSI